jgi:hypothetical protein
VIPALMAAVVLAAGFIKGAIGFGFPSLATPLLSLVVDVKTAVVVLLLPNIVMDGIQFARRGAPLAPVRRFGTLLPSGGVGIALGPRCYTGLTRSTDRGYPVINHVRQLLDGPIVWAPAANGAVVMSLRGGDFELTVGQDFSVGYLDHTSTSVLLYLQETFTFRVLTPQASVPLTYPAAEKKKSD